MSGRLDFTRCLGQLLNYAKMRSIPVVVDQVTQGERAELLVFRKTEPTTTGATGWVYLNQGTEPEYTDLGEFWASLHPLTRWTPDLPAQFVLTRNGTP